MLLAIDTATKYLGLALHDGHTLLAEQAWRTGNRHNELLAVTIQQMLAASEVTVDDLTLIAVANGPGSYTGLRIGVAMAKGLASAKQLPLIGVSTLDALAAAQPFHHTRHRLIAVVEAGRGRVIAGTYHVKKGRWVAADEPDILRWEDLLDAEKLTETYYITGEINELGLAAIDAARANQIAITLMHPAYRLRRAGFLAQEAWRKYEVGDAHDFAPAKLLPVYMNAPG